MLAGVAVLIATLWYMAHERTLYFWDDANFTALAHESYTAFFPAGQTAAWPYLTDGFAALHDSFGREHSLLFTLPVVALQRLFGESRTAFVTALTIAFFVPYCLAWSLVASRSMTANRRSAFWTVLIVSVLLPPAWMTVLHGYPDVGAAAILAFAAYVYLGDVHLKSWWRPIVIGLLLCLMPLFRRHYIFGVSAFLGSALAHQALVLFSGARDDGRTLVRSSIDRLVRLAIVATTLVLGLMVLAKPYLTLVMGTNYFQLYSSYLEPRAEVLTAYVSAYGVVLSLAAAAGYLIGFRSGIFARPHGTFLPILAVATCVQWVLIVRQLGLQYTTHFSAFVVIGAAALILGAGRSFRGWTKMATIAGVAAILTYRLFVGFAIVEAFDAPNDAGAAMAVNPPRVRRDYDEIKRLLTDLREAAPPGAVIHVAASSTTLNADIVRNGEKEMWGLEDVRLFVAPTPDIDSRDWYPLAPLLKADFVIVADPVQYCVNPDEQKVVRLAVEAFDEGSLMRRDFAPLPQTYALELDARARIYRRQRATDTVAALLELAREESLFSIRPGHQQAWLSLDRDHRVFADPDLDGTWRLAFVGPAGDELSKTTYRTRTMVFLDTPASLTGGEITAEFHAGGPWAGRAVSIRALLAAYETGVTISAGKPVSVTSPGTIRVPIAAPPPGARVRLLLEVTLPDVQPPFDEVSDVVLSRVRVR